jgi:hypothetical protein
MRLSNCIVGDWHTALGEFGLKTRTRYKEHPFLEVGTKINLVSIDTVTSKGNNYLKRQYKLLTRYRQQGALTFY